MLGTILCFGGLAFGGTVGGKLFQGLSLGTAGNSVAGIVGGAVLPGILSAVGLGGMGAALDGGSGMDAMSLVSSLGGGLVGGTGAMAVFGAVKNMMGK